MSSSAYQLFRWDFSNFQQGGGGNWRIYQDGGISHLEFHRVGSPCTQQIRAVARNNLGESAVDTVLVIEPQADFRPDLRHVEPGKDRFSRDRFCNHTSWFH